MKRTQIKAYPCRHRPDGMEHSYACGDECAGVVGEEEIECLLS